MSKQTLIIVGVLAATFGAGIGAGFFLFSDPSHSDLAPKASRTDSTSTLYSDAAAQDREQNNSLLSARIRELEKELTDPQQNRRATLADRLAFFKKYQKQIRLEPITQEMTVTPEMAALLDLTPEETKAIEQHLAETKAELDKLQDADTVLSKQTDTSVTYDIAADKQGSALKDKLQGLLTSDMGEDRADVFMNTDSYNYTHPPVVRIHGGEEANRDQLDRSEQPADLHRSAKFFQRDRRKRGQLDHVRRRHVVARVSEISAGRDEAVRNLAKHPHVRGANAVGSRRCP